MGISRWLTAGVAVTAGLAAASAMAPAIAGSSPAAAAQVGCTATAHIDSQWGSGPSGGEIVSFTVANTSAGAATRWTVTWTLGSGQSVSSAWNAAVTVSGTTATAVNAPYNGTLAAGASTTFGLQLAGTGPVPTPLCTNDAPGPASSSPAPGGSDVNLGVADSQSSVTLRIGETLGVTLTSAYKPLTVSGAALTQLSTSGGYPTGQPLVAQFRAVTPGTVTVSTVTDDPCFHTSPPCARPVALWTVQVTVLGTSSPSATPKTVTVTEANNRASIGLHVGDILRVNLAAMYWPPTLGTSGVLRLLNVTGGYPTGQQLLARYTAVALGQLDISTISDATCLHQATPCPSPQLPWTVHITVTT